MKPLKIKAEWASININREKGVIVCARKNGATQCFLFKSLDELKLGLDKRRVLVKKWAVAMPRSLCFLKQLSLPATDIAEALSMIEFELPSIIPIPVEEIVYSTTLLNKHDHMLDILICMTKQITLNDFLDPIKAIGIEPKKIILSSLAVQDWINSKISASLMKEPVISAILDDQNCVVQTSIEGSFQKANEFIFNEQPHKERVKNIISEILHQREDFEASARENITYALTGQDNYVSELKNIMTSVLQEPKITERIVIIPGPEIVFFNNESKENSFILNSEAVIACGLIELAINSKLDYSNLISRQSIKKQSLTALRYKYIITGILCAAFIFLLWLYLVVANWRIEKMSALIESKIDPIKDIANSVDKKRQQVRAVQGQLKNRGCLTEIINELYKYTPQNIAINKLTFVSKNNKSYIDIKGQADVLASAFDYTEAISGAKLLGDMQIKDAQQIPVANSSIVVFKSYCEFRNK